MDINQTIRKYLDTSDFTLIFVINNHIKDNLVSNKMATKLFVKLTTERDIFYGIQNYIRFECNSLIDNILDIKKMDWLTTSTIRQIQHIPSAERLYPLYRGINRFILSLIIGNVDNIKKDWDTLRYTKKNYELDYMIFHNPTIKKHIKDDDELRQFIIANKLCELITCNICFDECPSIFITNHGCCMNYCSDCAHKLLDSKCVCTKRILINPYYIPGWSELTAYILSNKSNEKTIGDEMQERYANKRFEHPGAGEPMYWAIRPCDY